MWFWNLIWPEREWCTHILNSAGGVIVPFALIMTSMVMAFFGQRPGKES